MDEAQIRSLVGEIIIAGFDGLEVTDHAKKLVVENQVRNIILFSRNVRSMAQVKALNDELQALAVESGYRNPLLICTDQENGVVRRIAPDLPGLPGNMALGACGDVELARVVAEATARQLLSAGINMNLAPDLDVNNNPKNPVIGVRSFGEDASSVARLGTAMIEGLQQAGVVACGKHFPGHGDTATDSHLALPTIPHSRERLESVEFVPFRSAIAANVDVLMTAHAVFPAFDDSDTPATLSRKVLTELLRNELGFTGVITTDCLEMNAISETIGVGEGAVRALLAGADMIMVSHLIERQEAAIEAMVQGVLHGRIPLNRLEQAAARVSRLRQVRLLSGASQDFDLEQVKREAIELQKMAVPRCVTIAANQKGLLPISLADAEDVALVMDAKLPHMVAADAMDAHTVFHSAVEAVLPDKSITLHLFREPGSEVQSDIESAVEDKSLILVGMGATDNTDFVELVRKLATTHDNVVIFALQAPYELSKIPEAQTSIAVYECTPWMVEAGVSALLGVGGTGRLPVSLGQAGSI